MKKISLKPVVFQLPKDVSPQIQKSISLAEATIRENNSLIENTLNSIISALNKITT